MSSNAALQRAKRLYRAQKAGHTGTLDPLASGLLPLCFGEATKFAQRLLDAPKGYLATIRFGATTTTGDAEGEIRATRPVTFERTDLEATLLRFVGPLSQIPPIYSALKFEGRPMYRYARAGEDVPRIPRAIVVHALDLVAWESPRRDRRGEVQQGHLRSRARRGHRRGARVRCASRRVAPDGDRRLRHRPQRVPSSAGGHDGRGSPGGAAAGVGPGRRHGEPDARRRRSAGGSARARRCPPRIRPDGEYAVYTRAGCWGLRTLRAASRGRAGWSSAAPGPT